MNAKRIGELIIILVFSLIGGVAGAFFFSQRQPPVQFVTKEQKTYIEENTALTQAVPLAERTVFGISGGGSGLILTTDGLAVALAEVIPAGKTYSFYVNGEDNVSYQILKRDPQQNLALIKLQKTSLPTAGFYDISQVKEGLRVFSVSAKQGSAGYYYSLGEGIVKSFAQGQMATDMAAPAGSPVFDINGNILGLIVKDGTIISIADIRTFAGI